MELLATTSEKARTISSGRVYRCENWHVFSAFCQTVRSESTRRGAPRRLSSGCLNQLHSKHFASTRTFSRHVGLIGGTTSVFFFLGQQLILAL